MNTKNFATYVSRDRIHGIDNVSFENKIKEIYENLKGKVKTTWLCETFNTLNTYDLLDDSFFDELHKKIISKIEIFAELYGNTDGYKPVCTQSWVNVSFPGNYQEFHIHPKSHFTSVYYVKVPPFSGEIHFESPTHNMYPLPYYSANENIMTISPDVGEIVMFPASLRHMVGVNKSDDVRIAISSNYRMEKE